MQEPFMHEGMPAALRGIRAMPPRQRVTVPAKLIQDLLDRAEMVEDIRAFDAAKARGGELIPAAVMDRIWAGENRVRAFREWRGLKQGELARAAGLSQAYVCELEQGKNVSARAGKALARALGVEVGDLLA
ncbi:MAG: helix-turn-helix transcriptional regulator [Rhodospirillaceae bacterium]|nr:helix-turn-helix transcriptional regulator [Rhodospirillaceae bacterium]